METWNTGPFDNEEAAGLLADIRDEAIELEALLPDAGHRYIDADQGELIVAMAHLAAGELPEGVSSEQVKELRTPENRERLRQSLEAVLADGAVSGLYTRWAEAGEAQLHEWKAKSLVDLS